MAKRVAIPNFDSSFTGLRRSLLMAKGQLYLVAVFMAIFLPTGSAGSVRVVAVAYQANLFPESFDPPTRSNQANTPPTGEQAVGPHDPMLEGVANDLAFILRKLGRNSEARAYEEKAASSSVWID